MGKKGGSGGKAQGGGPGRTEAAAHGSGGDHGGGDGGAAVAAAAAAAAAAVAHTAAAAAPAAHDGGGAAAAHHHQQQHHQHHQQQHHQPCDAAQPPALQLVHHRGADDRRVLLLFDLNGVLTDHTPPREEGRYVRRDHVVRPRVEALLALRRDFILGVYSSATVRTVQRALGLIRGELLRLNRAGLADGARGGALLLMLCVLGAGGGMTGAAGAKERVRLKGGARARRNKVLPTRPHLNRDYLTCPSPSIYHCHHHHHHCRHSARRAALRGRDAPRPLPPRPQLAAAPRRQGVVDRQAARAARPRPQEHRVGGQRLAQERRRRGGQHAARAGLAAGAG